MNGLENNHYFTLLLIANAIAILQLIIAWKWPQLGRISFFLLFAWASWINWKTAILSPSDYLEYGEFAWIGLYKRFIYGWFSEHIQLAVGFIATCQGLIAISMLMKEKLFRLGTIAAIIFLIAILPLGVGSGFPCTLIMALSMILLFKEKRIDYVWRRPFGKAL